MMKQIKKQENTIISSISNLKSNRNPLNVFFVLGDLKEIFISIWETLLNWIELNYSLKAKKQYLDILQSYKKAWIFELVYNYYLHNDWILRFKSQIDDYFRNSFFIDISFFYFTISRIEKYKVLTWIINLFYIDKEIRKKYFLIETYLEKKSFLQSISKEFYAIKYDKDSFFIIKLLNYFADFDFAKIKIHFNNTISSEIKVMKEITLMIFENREKYNDLSNLFIEIFIIDSEIYDEISKKVEEKKLFEIISFLKNDLISWINYDFSLDFDAKSNIKNLLILSRNFIFKNTEEKINFLLKKESSFNLLWKEKWDFARINFKRQFLEENYCDIIDLTLWITALPQDVFYLFKQKNLTLNLDELKLYDEIKELILYIDKSYFLNLLSPFLLKNISHYFNTSDQKYYIIKFILCIILPNSFWEYKKIYKFFYNLEAFHKNNLSNYVKRFFQFWWIFLIFLIVSFVFPFWVFLSFMILFVRKIIIKIISKLNPRLKLSLNFQLGSFALIIAIFSIALWSTIWFKDNISLTYNNFRWVFNVIILPTKETLKIFFYNIKLNADINWFWGRKENMINFWDIDYLNWKWLYEIKNNN